MLLSVHFHYKLDTEIMWFSVIILSVTLTHSIMFPVLDRRAGATSKMIFRHNGRLPLGILLSVYPSQTRVKPAVYSETAGLSNQAGVVCRYKGEIQEQDT